MLMKRIDGTEITRNDIDKLVNNKDVSINLDIEEMTGKSLTSNQIASIDFLDDIGRKDILKLLVWKDGGYNTMISLANYIEEVGKYKAKSLDNPLLDKAAKKSANAIKIIASVMLKDISVGIKDECKDDNSVVRELLTNFVNKIMSDKSYYDLVNKDIVDKYLRDTDI